MVDRREEKSQRAPQRDAEQQDAKVMMFLFVAFVSYAFFGTGLRLKDKVEGTATNDSLVVRWSLLAKLISLHHRHKNI